MSGPITRARLLELFDRLNEKLRQADQQGEVYVVGGAMMALTHDAKRVTDDVDSALVVTGAMASRAASRDGTAELAHAPARRRGGTQSSAGADAVAR